MLRLTVGKVVVPVASKVEKRKGVDSGKPGFGSGRPWSVYVLRCGDGSLYAGATNDVERRLERHRQGKGAAYTRSHLPVELVYVEEVGEMGAALRREAAIKRLRKAEKEILVQGKTGDGAKGGKD